MLVALADVSEGGGPDGCGRCLVEPALFVVAALRLALTRGVAG
jgi:hypothetical protein